jgi:hypothetical protein
MRHADAILVSWLVIHVETERRTCSQLDRSIGERADPELRTLQIGKDRDRPSCFLLDPTNNIVARLMVLMRTMAKVRAKYIRPRFEQRPDFILVAAGRSQRCDDLTLSMTAHEHLGRLGSRPWLQNQNRAEIVDIGQRRTGDDLVTQSLEEAVTVIVGQALLRIDPHSRRTRDRVWCNDCTRDLLCAIDSVRIGSQREDARLFVQIDRKRQQELDVATAPAVAAHCNGGFAARKQDQGFCSRLVVQAGLCQP